MEVGKREGMSENRKENGLEEGDVRMIDGWSGRCTWHGGNKGNGREDRLYLFILFLIQISIIFIFMFMYILDSYYLAAITTEFPSCD